MDSLVTVNLLKMAYCENILVAFNNVQNKVAEVEESENKKMLKDILPSGLGGLGNMFG